MGSLIKKFSWIKKSDTTTEEFRQSTKGGIALLVAKELQEKGDRFTAIVILKGLGMNISYTSNFEIITRENRLPDEFTSINTIYARKL